MRTIVAIAGFLSVGSDVVFAGAPVPVPLAGVAGPYGIAAAVLAYGGYRFVMHLRRDR